MGNIIRWLGRAQQAESWVHCGTQLALRNVLDVILNKLNAGVRARGWNSALADELLLPSTAHEYSALTLHTSVCTIDTVGLIRPPFMLYWVIYPLLYLIVIHDSAHPFVARVKSYHLLDGALNCTQLSVIVPASISRITGVFWYRSCAATLPNGCTCRIRVLSNPWCCGLHWLDSLSSINVNFAALFCVLAGSGPFLAKRTHLFL